MGLGRDLPEEPRLAIARARPAAVSECIAKARSLQSAAHFDAGPNQPSSAREHQAQHRIRATLQLTENTNYAQTSCKSEKPDTLQADSHMALVLTPHSHWPCPTWLHDLFKPHRLEGTALLGRPRLGRSRLSRLSRFGRCGRKVSLLFCCRLSRLSRLSWLSDRTDLSCGLADLVQHSCNWACATLKNPQLTLACSEQQRHAVHQMMFFSSCTKCISCTGGCFLLIGGLACLVNMLSGSNSLQDACSLSAAKAAILPM